MITIGIFGTFIVIVMVYVAFMIRYVLVLFHWSFVKRVLVSAFKEDLNRRYAPERHRHLEELKYIFHYVPMDDDHSRKARHWGIRDAAMKIGEKAIELNLVDIHERHDHYGPMRRADVTVSMTIAEPLEKEMDFGFITFMSKGNPGAMSFLMMLYETGAITAIRRLKTMGIAGTDLWVLWSDICRQDKQRLALVLEKVPSPILQDACSRQDRSGLNLINDFLDKKTTSR